MTAATSTCPLLPYDICNLKGVTRYSSKLLAKLKNEYLPKARSNGYRIRTVCCSYDTDVFEVRQPNIVNWNAIGKSVKRKKITDLYAMAHKTYKKGYGTKELIKSLNIQDIRNKRYDVLLPLEEALGFSKDRMGHTLHLK